MFPESLYVLSQRDIHITWLDPSLNGEVSAGQNAVNVGITMFLVPEGRCLVLSTVWIRAEPQAATSVRAIEIRIQPEIDGVVTTPEVRIAGEEFAVVAAQNRALAFSGELLIPPQWAIRGFATFDAPGVGNNALRGTAAGILIPVANIQRI